MTDRLNKTSICSIVFLDIIDYSKKPVSEQINDKDLFNDLINQALQNVAQNDRIILDTGDGAAITLMGSPEEALFIALTIRDGILDHNKTNAGNLRVRIGINLGSVRVVKDINDRPNIIGDGINVAQRIMSFAGENQILVSRSYFEVTSRLTNEITDMFTYSGIKQDKHIREHEVYSIKAKAENESMPTAQFSAPADKAEEAVMLKDILKPSNLIIALVASVLLILMGWYMFILKPALSESNPIELRLTEPSQQPLSKAPSIDNATVVPEPENAIVTSPTTDTSTPVATKTTTKKPQVSSVKTQQANSEKRPSAQNRVVTPKQNTVNKQSPSNQQSVANRETSKTQKDEPSKMDSFKALFPPVSQATCTQAQIAMNQCQQN